MFTTYSEEGIIDFIKNLFRGKTMTDLKAECYAEIMKLQDENISTVTVQMRVCVYNGKLYITQMPMTGINDKTNGLVKIPGNTDIIKSYLIAKWKVDHAHAKGIEWNVVTFTCDGDSVHYRSSFSQEVLEAAMKDVKSGVVDNAVSSLFSNISYHILSPISEILDTDH